MEKVLITGGAGFFGTHLTKGLTAKGYEVRVIDIAELKGHDADKEIEFQKADIRDREAVRKACVGVDKIFHNAAILPISRAAKKAFWQVNVGGTENLLEAALNVKAKKVIFISSSAPYGIPSQFPITEETEFNPVCDYGRSKIEAEGICMRYRREGLDVIILRPRTIIGRGRLGLFQILFSWIADNKNIYIIGKGDNLFQLLSAEDLTSACIMAMERDCKNEDFNLGADSYGTVREDLQGLIDYTGSSSKIISLQPGCARAVLTVLDMLGLSPLTPWHYRTPDKPFYFDISKAKNILGWQPAMSNLKMFKDSYDWYISNRAGVDSDFGTTHKNAVRQRLLRLLKGFS